MTSYDRNKTKARLDELHTELFNMANVYAIDKQPIIGVELHCAANRVLSAIKMIEDGPTLADSDRQIEEWCDNQLIPIGSRERALIKNIMGDRNIA